LGKLFIASYLTPLRIQQKKQILSDTMTAKDFLIALVRRYYLLDEFYGHDYQAPNFTLLSEAAMKVVCINDFEPYQWQRYSTRQKQAMTFNGVLGTLRLSGELSVFLPLLVLGQWIHVGSKTTFGMGHYEII